MIGRDDVEEKARANGGGDHADTPFHETQEDGGQALQHTAGGHGSSKAHGADDQPNRIHHTGHTSGSDQVVQGGIAGLDLRTAIEGHK